MMLQALLQLPRKLLKRSLVRYLITGGTAFMSEYLAFLALLHLVDAHLYVANSLSFGVGLIVSFSINRLWAFSQDKFKQKAHHQFGLYGLLAAINLLISNVLIGTLTAAGVNSWLGKLIVTATIAVWNFVIFKYFIFAKAKD